jgi:hypothetical protein
MARIGVIRSDVGKLNIHDLEPVSQWAPSVQPRGQERLVARPDPKVGTNTYYSVETILDADSHNLTSAQIVATAPLIIARGLPLGGSINVTKSNLDFDYSGVDAAAYNFAGNNMDTNTYNALIAELAPSFVETGVFLLSFDHGSIAGYKRSTFSARSSTGAAIGVVDSDGTTPFTLP